MKRFAIVLGLVCLSGCVNDKIEIPNTKISDGDEIYNVKVIVLDGCEYLSINQHKTVHCVTHKGNCKYCVARFEADKTWGAEPK